MKLLVLAAALLLCSSCMHCVIAWKAVEITQGHTVVKVASCTDPKIYLQFKKPITVSPISIMVMFPRMFPSNPATMLLPRERYAWSRHVSFKCIRLKAALTLIFSGRVKVLVGGLRRVGNWLPYIWAVFWRIEARTNYQRRCVHWCSIFLALFWAKNFSFYFRHLFPC